MINNGGHKPYTTWMKVVKLVTIEKKEDLNNPIKYLSMSYIFFTFLKISRK